MARFVVCGAVALLLAAAMAAEESAACDERCEAEDSLADDMRSSLLQVDVGWRARAAEAATRATLAEVPEAPRSAAGQGQTGLLQLLHQRQMRAFGDLAAESLTGNQTVDCEQYPMFCDPKVNCAGKPVSNAERHSLEKRLATPTGHANPRAWCLIYPLHAMSLQKCVLESNPLGYAEECYAQQEKLGLVDADAVYCFAAGMCNNTEVTLDTTVQQSEAICDHDFGRNKWLNIGWKDFNDMMDRAKKLLANYGQMNLTDYELFTIAQREAKISAEVACAMGNYQCDVFYCKQKFCTNDHWRTKYGNLSWVP